MRLPAAPVRPDPASATAAAPARRLQQPSWRDARLVVGVLLVLLSVVAGARVVSQARHTTQAWVAARDLSPGERVERSDLRPVEVGLGGLGGAYLPAAGLPAGRDHVVQPVDAGELVPADAVATREQVQQRQVSVPVPAGSAGALVRGTAVEVWVSRRSSEGGADVYAAPRRVVPQAFVAREPAQATSLTGAGPTVTLQLWAPSGLVPQLISAVDARDRVTAVPLPGTVLRGDS